MREWMNLFEDDEIIRKRGTDKRDMEQKLRDIIDHPSTEPFLREVTQRKLDKLLGARQAAADKIEADKNLPSMGFQVNAVFGNSVKPIPREDWDKVYVGYGSRVLTYRQVIEAVLPLGPFRIDFDSTPWQYMTSFHTTLWFHPEDEPENGQAVTKMVKRLHGSCADGDGHYLRGGTSKYAIWWDKAFFNPASKKRR